MVEGIKFVPFTAEFPLRWEALPDPPEENMCSLGSPVPTLPTLSHPCLRTGLSPPLDSEPRREGPGQGCLSHCCIPNTAQHRARYRVGTDGLLN